MALVAQSRTTGSDALARTMDTIHTLGLAQNLIELETQGYTTLKGVLSPATIARAKAAIVKSTERFTGKGGLDIEDGDGSQLKGMTYIPHLLYDDEVFEEILMEESRLRS